MKNLIMVSNSVSIDGVPNRIKILPLGMVKSQKGNFLVDMESYESIRKAFKDRRIDVVIDYEHQTLDNVEAPAAGWVKDLEVSTDGIYGQVEWSDKAIMYLKNKEYRYLSPVVYVRKDNKKAAQLHSVALTNTPAIDGMTPIVNSLNGSDENTDDKELNVALSELLGLPENATKEEIIKAVSKLLEDKQDLELEANSIKVERLKNEINHVINMAMQEGKITPPQRAWAERMALKDMDSFKEYILTAPQIVPMGEMNIVNDGKLNPAKRSRAKELLGVSDEDYIKYSR